MNRQERSPEIMLALATALQGAQAHIWTCLPGLVVDVQPELMTCSVQPTVQAKFINPQTQLEEWLPLPKLIFCPLVFPQAGGFALTFPVTAGDEVLVVFSSRCIDLWWQNGGVQPQAELRMHDISDGFAIAGVRSTPRALTDWSQSAVELRSDDGAAKVSIHADLSVDVVAPAQINLTAPLVTITGNLQVTGTVVADGDVTGAGTSLHTHRHGGVSTGSGNTGTPV